MTVHWELELARVEKQAKTLILQASMTPTCLPLDFSSKSYCHSDKRIISAFWRLRVIYTSMYICLFSSFKKES